MRHASETQAFLRAVAAQYDLACSVLCSDPVLTLTKSRAGWTIEKRVAGILWWAVTYQTEAEARETLRRMEEEMEKSRSELLDEEWLKDLNPPKDGER